MDEALPPQALENASREAAADLPTRRPVSTYRLQFYSGFTFRDAEAILQYLEELGITDVYSSPYFRARAGSIHGYDITDYQSLNPEVGTEEDFNSFTEALRARGMGLIMDIVPNHMSIGSGSNLWWRDVLENGRASPFAAFFDIDWNPVKEELEGKVIIPVLGGQYGDVLESGDLRLAFEEGGFFVSYYEHRFPIDPSTYNQILEHVAKLLGRAMGEDGPEYQELLSIITALEHLPSRDARDREKKEERLREKEVIKRRISVLHEESEEFRGALSETVERLNGDSERPESFDPMDMLLSSQVYRLAFWQVATEEINYRRFFDINDLAALRNDFTPTFEQTHSMVFRHVAEGRITGLRVDHPDGLHDPEAYFSRLQRECFLRVVLARAGSTEPGDRDLEFLRQFHDSEPGKDPAPWRPFYIVGEKILTGNELIPRHWAIMGTTGYSFMNSAGGLFVDHLGSRPMTDIYRRFIRRKTDFSRLLYEKKRLIMNSFMAGEINVLGRALNILSEQDRRFRDFTLNSLIEAITETIAFFPVYRTYVNPEGITEQDLKYIDHAIGNAMRARRDLSPSIFGFLRSVLTLDYPGRLEEAQKSGWLDFAMRFQQLTGPVMAKGMEDTVFYAYNRLVSLNEVGGSPERFGTSREAFHSQNLERLGHWPLSLTATSTHDHKRSEDVRVRISVLSEMPEGWKDRLAIWSRLARRMKRRTEGGDMPERNDEYLLYQSLVGAWPHGGLKGGDDTDAFAGRIKDYMVKSARESKANTTWISPDAEYEDALREFTDRIVRSEEFRGSFEDFQQTAAYYGALNSLSQVLLKVTAPGVPDFYQGTELLSLTLVDPDNRVPVDYAERMRHLQELKRMMEEKGPGAVADEMLKDPGDGRAKLFLTWRALGFRRARSDLFLEGEYLPLEATGPLERHLVAFARRLGEKCAVTIVPRFFRHLVPEGTLPLRGLWEDNSISLPEGTEGVRLRDAITGDELVPETLSGRLAIPVWKALSKFPVCLLETVN
jgi:(1->4)-alpha-D-glucan 1-alpha-D-glucosylmutase